MTAAGGKVRVLVATTAGPAEVLRIERENPNVRSVICLAGATAALPVSPAFDSFVRQPTGVIERATGHPVYRVDVSAPIEDGESWQLGLCLAHMLKLQDRLAERGEEAERTVLASGTVDRDLGIGPVGHLAEKLARTPAPATTTDGAPPLFLYPAASADQLKGASGLGWRLRPVGTVAEAMLQLMPVGPALGRRRFGLLAGLAAAAVVAGVAVMREATRPEPALHGSAVATVRLAVSVRQPDGGCAEVRTYASGRLTYDTAPCWVETSLVAGSAGPVRYSVDLDWQPSGGPGALRLAEAGVLAPGERFALRLEPPGASVPGHILGGVAFVGEGGVALTLPIMIAAAR